MKKSRKAKKRAGRSRPASGGILLDAFLILVFLAGGIWLWFSWEGGGLSRVWERVRDGLGGMELPHKPFAETVGPAGQARKPSSETAGPVKQGIWLQNEVRTLLAERGVQDSHVLKTYNRERHEAGAVWLEDTLEVRVSRSFKVDGFVREIQPRLREKELAVMAKRLEEGKWILEMGDNRRVFERVVFNMGMARP